MPLRTVDAKDAVTRPRPKRALGLLLIGSSTDQWPGLVLFQPRIHERCHWALLPDRLTCLEDHDEGELYLRGVIGTAFATLPIRRHMVRELAP